MNLSHLLPLLVGSAVAGVLASMSPAQALVFNVGGTDYEVTTQTGTFLDLSTTLQQNPWWGNGAIASDAAIGSSSLGVNEFFQGPIFAYSVFDQGSAVAGYYENTFGGVAIGDIGVLAADVQVYAVATAATPVPFDIPGGATIPTVGSLIALGAMRKVKKSLALKTRIAETIVS
ncbi:hypothetical protein [Anabaena sp. UHCC 0451]|uniref:hypothetical protein n=1 Tax=Anabaena sp. UHCC 0451 TaxID=2055235 RepID=UPI002B2082F6|nr:hypothetical protein [Anabaena sp. UHCC 0451]MEA5576932.1 hypothetical protein [Anabaena sp. UHCC 0451]